MPLSIPLIIYLKLQVFNMVQQLLFDIKFKTRVPLTLLALMMKTLAHFPLAFLSRMFSVHADILQRNQVINMKSHGLTGNSSIRQS